MIYRSPHDQDEGDLETGSRMCRECDTRQPMTEFHWANRHRHRRRICKTCVDLRARARRAADPARHREVSRWSAIKRKYGLSQDQFEDLLDSQDARCAICRRAFLPSAPHVDHSHKSGRVRGLLCFDCNTGLGKFHDDINLLRAATRYLERTETT